MIALAHQVAVMLLAGSCCSSPFVPSDPIPPFDPSAFPPVIIDLDDFPHIICCGGIPIAEPPYELVTSFDLDGDGIHDIVIEQRPGRGMLSTYFTETRLRALGTYQLLRGGSLLLPETELRLADLISTVDHTPLCSVGGSLRFPEESYEKFSGGAWWNKSGTLGVVHLHAGVLRVGWVELTVAELGEVQVGKVQFEAFDRVLTKVPKAP